MLPTEEQSTGSRPLSQLNLVMMISFTFFLGMAMLSPVLPLYIIQVGASKLQLGLLMSFSALVTIATRLPFNSLVRRVGAWTMLPATLIMQAVAYVLYYLVTQPVLLYPIVALQAMAWSIFGPTAVTVVSGVAPSDRVGYSLGKYYTSIALSMFVGPLLGSALMRYISIRQAILIVILFPVAGLITFLLIRRAFDRTAKERSEAEAPKSDSSSAPLMRSLGRVIRNRNVLVLFASRITFATAISIMMTLFSVYAKETLLLSASTISLLYSARGATNVAVRMPVGKLSDRIGRKPLFLMAFGLGFLSFVLLSRVQTLALLGIAMAILGIAWGTRIAPSTAMLNESVLLEDRGPALTLQMTTFDVGRMVGSSIAGATAESIETPRLFLLSAFPFLPILLLIAFGLRETLKSVHGRRAEQP